MPSSEIDKAISSNSLAGGDDARRVWSQTRRRWFAAQHYIWALLMTEATTLLYLRLASVAGNQPAPIVFLIPITLSAYLGGLGPGLVSTVTSALAAWYFLTPPVFTFATANRIDYVRLASLLFVGALVSVVSESLHRAKGQVAADRSQRRRDEALLLDSERQFTSLFENMGEGFAHCKILLNEQGRAVDFVYLDVNPAFERLTGLDSAVGKKATELFPGIRELHPELLETYGRVVSTRRPEKFEVEFLPLKGWFSVSVYSPRPQEFVAVFEDVTEQKEGEKAVRAEGAELAAIYANVPYSMLLLDQDLRICKSNRPDSPDEDAAEASLVDSQIGAVVHCLNALKGPGNCGRGPQCERCSLRLTILDTLAAGRNHRDVEAVFRAAKTGGLRDVTYLASTAKLEIAGQPRVLVTLADITERKESEKRLREQFALMKCITDKSSDSIFVTDSEGRVTFLNPEAEKVFGFAVEELKGKVLHDAIHHHRADGRPFPLAECPAVRTFKTGAPLRNYEDIYFRKDGSMLDVLGSTAVLEADGERLGIVYVLHDVTERRQEAKAKLRSQKLEALGTIAGGIAHDFNNILGSINGNAQYAISDLGASGPVRDCLLQIAKAGDRAAGLVRRILNFSVPREQTPVVQALQPIVDEAIKLVRASTSATIEIRTDFAPDLPPVNVDSSQIHQVVVNLMTNAAHAIGGRPGRIEVRADALDVNSEDISSRTNLRAGRYVRLYVADDGCGIDPLILERIFDPFFTTKPVGQGTGLGLSIVHGIVTNLSGAITVDSKVGEGTAIHVYLPAVERRVENVGLEAPRASRPHRERVLYVDDEEDLVFLATNRLERRGCKVTGFTDPGKALHEFQRRPGDFDVVVTDVAMPHMSGFDLARQILAVRPETPIVMTTGYVRLEDRAAAEGLGIREIVPKPCRIEDLTGAFERLLEAQASAANSSQ